MSNEIREAEILVLEALKHFENRASESEIDDNLNSPSSGHNFNTNKQADIADEENNNKEYIEKRTTRKISSVLEFLAEIYELKKE